MQVIATLLLSPPILRAIDHEPASRAQMLFCVSPPLDTEQKDFYACWRNDGPDGGHEKIIRLQSTNCNYTTVPFVWRFCLAYRPFTDWLTSNLLSNVKYGRSDYAKVWDREALTEDSAKNAVLGVLDEDAIAASGEVTKHHLIEWLGVNKDDVVLEIGCGVGRVGAAIAPVCRQWIGCDVSANMLEHTRRRLAQHKNVRVEKISGYDLSNIPDASVDVVYSTIVFMHLDEWDRFSYVREGLRILKPGGRMLVDNFDATSDDGWKIFMDHAAIAPSARPPFISKSSTPQELENYFARAGFVDITTRREQIWVFVNGVKP